MRPSRRYRIFIHVAAVLVSLVFLAPFLWLFVASIAPQTDLLARPLHWIPAHPSLHRYSQIFTAKGDNVFSNFRSNFSLKLEFILRTMSSRLEN